MPSLLSCCAPLAEETRLLSDCYPPKKQLPSSTSFNPALPSAGIDTVKPLSQELSRLTYYAANKPGKLRAIGEELDQRVAKHTRAAKGGNGKERVMLLISLSILRSLISECRRELGLFASSIVRCLDQSLSYALSPNLSGASGTSSTVGVDLELAVAAGTAFTTFATYATASTFGADDVALNTYLSVLGKFAALATFTPPNGAKLVQNPEKAVKDGEKGNVAGDFEIRNRTRLIGLAALIAAVQSDLLNASQSDFGRQTNIFIPALMTNLWLGDLEDLRMETAKAQINTSPSPYFTEFQARPRLSDRRAPSLHAHIIGEKGPATSDVVGGALRTLRELVESCHSNQLNTCLRTTIDYLDGKVRLSGQGSASSAVSGWRDQERCCWLAESIASYAMLGYRYNVPVTLLDQLVYGTKDAALTDKEVTLTEMLISLFSAEKLSLVGIAPAELLNSLLDIVIARVRVEPKDALLPRLVQCVYAIGSHVYYIDQTNDMMEVVITRIAEVQAMATAPTTQAATGVSQKTQPTTATWHQEVIRVMVSCMVNLMLSSEPTLGTALPPAAPGDVSDHMSVAPSKGKGPSNSRINTPDINVIKSPVQGRSSRRNPISPEIWQDTLPLLCEATYAVRAEYARALILYLRQEFPASVRILTNGGETEHGLHLKQARLGAIRFLHALNATIYTLAFSSRLGYAGPAKLSVASVGPVIQEISPSPLFDSPRATSPTTTKSIGTPSRAIPTPRPRDNDASEQGGPPPSLLSRRSSKLVSLPIHRINHSTLRETISEHPSMEASAGGAETVATAYDYLALSVVLVTALRVLPVEGITTIVPMLIAIDSDAGHILVRQPNEEDDAYLSERRRACKEVVCSAWREIASHYALHDLLKTIEQIQASFPGPPILPPGPYPEAREGLGFPEEPVNFPTLGIRGETSSSLRPIVDPAYAVNQLANTHQFQSEMKLPAEEITRILSQPWSVHESLSNSVEGQPYDVSRRSSPRRAKTALAELARPGSALSMQSFGLNGQRGIDVSDLREALGMTRAASTTKLASAAPSIQTNGTRQTMEEPNGLILSPSTRRLRPDDAREILKDILKEKKPRTVSDAKQAL